MSVARAGVLVREMVRKEQTGPGDTDNALRRLARHYGIGFWTLSHLRKGNAKTCDTTLYERVRTAYLDLCVRQIEALQHEIAIEEAGRGDDDDLADLGAKARALAAEIAARKGAMK